MSQSASRDEPAALVDAAAGVAHADATVTRRTTDHGWALKNGGLARRYALVLSDVPPTFENHGLG